MHTQEEIKAKGFDIVRGSGKDIEPPDLASFQQQAMASYNKIKIGAKTLEDATIKVGTYRQVHNRFGDKCTVLRAIRDYDLDTMREISDFYYKTSGIYARILRYMAFMYCYDWYVTPFVNDKSLKKEKILTGFYKVLGVLDNFNVKKVLGDIALNVLRYGAYYGYKVKTDTGWVLQDLPCKYCRSRYFFNGKPAVEFNMKFFDDSFKDTTQKMRVLKMFPPEFSKGYALYKQGKLTKTDGDYTDVGWYLLDPEMAVKFTANGEDYPMFISVIPLIIDLDIAQDLDRKKVEQRLLKILIQKMPLDKNGDLIFDVDEAQQLHNNAVQMLSRAIGIDVLTTFADTTVETLTDSAAATANSDDLERVERQLYNEAGVSQKQFNTDGNLALEKSILNDEATIYNMILQFESFLNDLIIEFNAHKKQIEYRVQILKTTIYNFKEMAKLYKEQTQLGYSKMLPQIALGQSQSSILANAYFENDILNLVDVFIPPLMSSTMNENILNRARAGKDGAAAGEDNKVGRKEKADDEKAEKTILNKESQS